MAYRGEEFLLPPGVSFPDMLNGKNQELGVEWFRPDHFKARWSKDGRALLEVGIWGRLVKKDGTRGEPIRDYFWAALKREGGLDLSAIPAVLAEVIQDYAAVNDLSVRWSQIGLDNSEPLDDADDPEGGTQEGRLLVRKHYSRERDPRVRKKKIDEHLAEHGRLFCMICSFDFHATYGPHGRDFIECHHIIPLSQFGETTTRKEHLILICANCHRMIHHRKPWLAPHELRAMLSHSLSSSV